jgi:heptosyltransferase-2
LGPAWTRDLYAGEAFAHQFLTYPKGWNRSLRRAKRDLLSQVRSHRFDAAILLQNAFEAAAFVRLAGIPERIGYRRDARGWLLTRSVTTPTDSAHERFYYLELLRRAGLIADYDAASPIALGHAPEARRQGRERFTASGLGPAVIGISPGAAFGSAKRWFPERFAAAAISLARDIDASVAVFGSPEERPLTETVAQQIEAARIRVENFAGRTSLREFIALVAACRLMLTNDSGAMHVAYACGTPSVTVFGSTDHIGTGPVGPLARIVREPVDCAPCKLRECPIDHRCMTRIDVPRVASAALELLQIAPARD